MSKLNIGDEVYIQSYKHDGSIHRTWCKGLVIDILEHTLVVVTDHAFVVESDNRRWLTKEPAICFFYDNHWFNIISMIRRSGIYYYCNMASPSIYDGEAIKNIDYDLDVKVYSDGKYEILDEDEYRYHKKVMNYPKEIDEILQKELANLCQMIKNEELPFTFSYINDYLMSYFNKTYKGDKDEVNK